MASRFVNGIDTMALSKPIKIAIDTVFFQMSYSGITKVWETIFKNLPDNKDNRFYEIIILHRGGNNNSNSNSNDNGNTYRFKPDLNIEKRFKVLKINEFNYFTMNQDVDYLNHICKKEKFDIFISTYYTYCTVVPNVLLIHDMIPETFKLSKNHMWIQKDKAILNASSFIAISKTTQSDLIKFYPHIKNDKYSIKVIYNSIPKSGFKYDDSLLIKNNIKPLSYIFAMASNNEEYKNINLIKSLDTRYGKELSKMLENHLPIIMLCKTNAPNRITIEGNIMCLSYVTDNMLNSLYKNALCFVCPSKYEAFAQSTPVIAFKIPIFEEIGGGGINFIDNCDSNDSVSNAKSLFEKIQFIHKNEGKTVSTRVDFGLKQVAKFTEEDQAYKYDDYFKNIRKNLLEPKPFINLIIQSYKETNPERLKELEYCIIKNLENPYINSIHDFGNIIADTYISGNSTPNSTRSNRSSSSNSSDSSDSTESNSNSNNKNISSNKFYDTKYIKVDNPDNKWMTYDMAFDYSNNFTTMDFGNYWCIVNLDIFLDTESRWDLIKGKLNDGFIYAQSRHELNIPYHGDITAKMDDNFAKLMHCHTQDAWLFKNPIIVPSHLNCDFELGFLGCDNAIADRLIKSGYKLINQPITYKIFHYDSAKGKTSANFIEKHKSETKLMERKNEKPKNKYPERIGSYLVPNYDQLLSSDKDIDFISVINGLGGCSNLERYEFISKLMSDRIIMNNP